MFGSILTVLVTVMHVYVFWRASSVPIVKSYVPDKILVGTGAVIWLIFFFGRVHGHGFSGSMPVALEFIGMTWMAILFLTSFALLIIEVISGFGFFLPQSAPKLRGLALIAGGMLSVLALVQGLRPPEVINYEVSLAGLPRAMDGTVIVALSDLHLGSQLGKSWLADRVAQVQRLRPDLVVLLGDIFEGHGAPPSDFLPVLRNISAPLGVWAVPGNHEFHGGGSTGLSLIKASGIRLLFNHWVQVSPGLVLAGIEDLTANRRAGRNNDPLAKTLKDRPPGAAILLSHTPLEYQDAARAGVGLMLSGHTHGGQIWPFGYLVQSSYPLLGGRYEVVGMTVIVCRGTGTWGPRMRLWSAGEILRVTLHQRTR